MTFGEISPVIGERMRDALVEHFGLPRGVVDTADVARTVGAYARRLGCNLSNCAAAISWALRNGYDTTSCIRAGKRRVSALLDRQRRSTLPPSAA